MSTLTPARTYNQNHIARKYTAGKRRLSIYWTWSYPWESQRDPAAMENRFSTMTEVRTVLWPAYETPEWSAAQFLQGIAGTLELFHGVVTSLKEEHENSASRLFSNDRDCLAPHVHSRRAKGSVGPCRSEMTLDVESVVGGCVS